MKEIDPHKAIAMIHEGRIAQNTGKRLLKEFLTDENQRDYYYSLDALRDRIGRMPYSKLVDYGIQCMMHGCNADEVKHIIRNS